MTESLNTTATLTLPRSLATSISPAERVICREPRIQLEWDERTGAYRLGITL